MKKRSQLKFYALTCAFFACSSVAMENEDKQEENNNNNKSEQKQNFDLNKFVQLYKEVRNIDEGRFVKNTTNFRAALHVWSILNKKYEATEERFPEEQFAEILKIISSSKSEDVSETNDALDCVFIKRFSEMKNKENKKLLEILITKGADINFNKVPSNKVSKMSSSMSGANSGSLLHRAVRENSVDWIDFLVTTMGADINNKDIKNRTPIMLACKENNIEVVKTLLSHKNIDINMADSDKHTPLYWAVKNENFDMTELLLANGAKLEQEQDIDNEKEEDYDDEDNDNEVIPATNSKSYEVKKTSKGSGFWSLFGY